MFQYRIVGKRPDEKDRRKNEYLLVNLYSNRQRVFKSEILRKLESRFIINANIHKDGRIEILNYDKKETEREIPFIEYYEGYLSAVKEEYLVKVYSYIKEMDYKSDEYKKLVKTMPKSYEKADDCGTYYFDVHGLRKWAYQTFNFKITKLEMMDVLELIVEHFDGNWDYFSGKRGGCVGEWIEQTFDGAGNEYEVTFGAEIINDTSPEAFKFIVYSTSEEIEEEEEYDEGDRDGFNGWGDYYRWKNGNLR